MQIVRLVYASIARPDLHISELMQIRKQAKTFNAAHDITGVLCYGSQAFLHLLEGSRDAVNALYVRIVADPRHSQVVILSHSVTKKREFREWPMKMISVDEPFASDRRAVLALHTKTPKFDPMAMSGRQAIGLLRDLANIERAHTASLENHLTQNTVAPPAAAKARLKGAKRSR